MKVIGNFHIRNFHIIFILGFNQKTTASSDYSDLILANT